MSELLPPLITGLVFSAGLIALCFWRPEAGRVFLGIFFIAMGLGVNLMFLLLSPEEFVEFILEYGGDAWLPTHRWVTDTVIARAPTVFALGLVLFEVAVGMLMLGSGRRVKAGLVGSMVFVAALAGLNSIQLAWAGMLVGQGHLLRQDFDRSLLDMVRDRRRSTAGGGTRGT